MCGRCRCPKACGCNTSCCCCFKIPIGVGYVVCNLWLLMNGVAFPVISFAFWPTNHIFYGSCLICGVNFIFVCISLVNMWFKVHKLFNAVLYGIFAIYLAGGLMIAIAVNVDVAGNSALLVASFQTQFGISIHPSSTFRILQTIQIMFYGYLFASYVYCGFILQLYEIRNDKRYKKGEPITVGNGNLESRITSTGERDLLPHGKLPASEPA